MQKSIKNSVLALLSYVALQAVLPPAAKAELYIYEAPDGTRVISDRVLTDHKLVTRRDTVTNAGHILADRPFDEGDMADFKAHIRVASHKYKVDPALIDAIIKVESAFQSDAVSYAGATGLMQLMPGTASDLGVHDRYDPRQNIHGGVKYLSELMDRFEGDLLMVIAGYHAGPNAVAQHGGIPPNRPATTDYVNKVMKAYHEFRMLRYGSHPRRAP